jgi:hypothetical protein
MLPIVTFFIFTVKERGIMMNKWSQYRWIDRITGRRRRETLTVTNGDVHIPYEYCDISDLRIHVPRPGIHVAASHCYCRQ